MPRQSTLWPIEKPATAQRIWEDLDEPERTRVIAALARLISQVASPKALDKAAEDNHER